MLLLCRLQIENVESSNKHWWRSPAIWLAKSLNGSGDGIIEKGCVLEQQSGWLNMETEAQIDVQHLLSCRLQ